jgi:hypothetical protein|eukprot:COSAG06_NODE_1059_length_10885_cov_7.620434_3_plen_94_part_00
MAKTMTGQPAAAQADWQASGSGSSLGDGGRPPFRRSRSGGSRKCVTTKPSTGSLCLPRAQERMPVANHATFCLALQLVRADIRGAGSSSCPAC